MKWRICKEVLAILIIFILFFTNIFVPSSFSSKGSNRLGCEQPYNKFRSIIWGGTGDQADAMVGWNLTIIENLNGDLYPDLAIGAPFYKIGSDNEIGVVFIYYGKPNSGFNDINCTKADVIIRGEGTNNRFGWDVADAGDVNGDGINDLIVGAPGINNGRGRAYIFYGGELPNSADLADRILFGATPLGYYGASVSSAGDVNSDGYDDVIVGAPSAGQAILSYGYKDKLRFNIDIWDDDKSSQDIVDFRLGVNNTKDDLSTWGRNKGNDGWDFIDSFADPTGLYFHGSNPTKDHVNIYAPWEPDGPEADGFTWGNRSSLEIMIGRNHTNINPYHNVSGYYHPGASAAWGIEFNITQNMFNYLSRNSSLLISFDYYIIDTNKIWKSNNATSESCAILSRIWNSSGKFYIGDVEIEDYYGTTRCVFYYRNNYNAPPWGPFFDNFEFDISDYIDKPGSYYWDFGCYLYSGWFMADDGIMVFYDNITMKIVNQKNVVIQGMRNSGFGTTVTNIGDLNDDNRDDILIGAPSLDGGHVALIKGKRRFKNFESISNLNPQILTGNNDGDKFGYSIASNVDVDNDGLLDAVIGAPGGNYANVYYGSTLKKPPLVPDLWEIDEETNTPQIEFNSGLRTFGNTPGPSGADDGWDTWDGVYGYQSTKSPGSSTKYNGEDGIDPDSIAEDDELIIAIGARYGNGAEPDSGAYGIEFKITKEMIELLEAGGNAVISYDWRFKNYYLDDGDHVWIKTYIRNNTEDFDLGWDLDSNDDNEVYWAKKPEKIKDVYLQACTNCFNKAGYYYLDFGAKVLKWEYSQYSVEDGTFYFDNVYLRINYPADFQLIGPAKSGFGFSVGICDKLNYDGIGDIVVGAPYYDSPNGKSSGGIFGFLITKGANKIFNWKNSEYLMYGENVGDNLGWAIEGPLDINNDEYSEFFSSAINYHLSSSNVGKIYLLGYSRVPRIRLLCPEGGEIISNTFTLYAVVTDPDDNIDLSKGVYFYYSINNDEWILIGNTPDPSVQETIYKYFEMEFNTSTFPDGSEYCIKASVQDLDLKHGQCVSPSITIDNSHTPILEFQSPKLGEVIKGDVEISVLVKESEFDLIGGGLDLNKGVQFFFSKDKSDWLEIGRVHKGKNDIFKIILETRTHPDGEYWIKVNATDLDGFNIEQIINVLIDNPSRVPSIQLLSPLNVTNLNGTVIVSATAYDFDGDINSSGVSFLINKELKPEQWVTIGNAPDPKMNKKNNQVYSISWDTTNHEDDWYCLKAMVNDISGLINESSLSYFSIHNKKNNPPFIELTTPKGGKQLEVAQVISVRVRDLEDNIDPNGVFYYYSSDDINWQYLGNIQKPRSTNNEYYDFLWSTDTIEDGWYWINVSVTDETGLLSWDKIDEPILIHNSENNPPFIEFLTPSKGQYINETFNVQTYVIDLENNIGQAGVTFSGSNDKVDWTTISNVITPIKGENIYQLIWDTNMYLDGIYWLRAEVTDSYGEESVAVSKYFFIHNHLYNPPVIRYLDPPINEVNGSLELRAFVFDLEKEINADGVKFYYSTTPQDLNSWILIGSDQKGTEIGLEELFVLAWDTNEVPDNIYWIQAIVTDETGLTSKDISNNSIIVHNKINNPPIISLITPIEGDTLSERQSIVVEVIDFENDVESVTFFYSSNKNDWKIIETKAISESGNRYKIIWITNEIENGDYYILVRATDNIGNTAEITEGPFTVVDGKTTSDSKEGGISQNLQLYIIIIIFIIILLLVIFTLHRRSKRREKEIIEEVAAEVKQSQAIEGEIVSVPKLPQDITFDSEYQTTLMISEPDQTYLPSTELPSLPPAQYETEQQQKMLEQESYREEIDYETLESYKKQMNEWKKEGFNISRLENLSISNEIMFNKTYPIFASNITKLKEIANKINSLDTVGHEQEIESIRLKLFEPDRAFNTKWEFKNLQGKISKSVQIPTRTTETIQRQTSAVEFEDVPMDIQLPETSELVQEETSPEITDVDQELKQDTHSLEKPIEPDVSVSEIPEIFKEEIEDSSIEKDAQETKKNGEEKANSS